MAYGYKGATLDLSAGGRGQQQILLLLAYVLANPGTTLLLDEPDAHLEVVRQRETYDLLSELVQRQPNHRCKSFRCRSEVVLKEAARKDALVAFVGKPHRIDDRGSQVRIWLADYPIDHLYQAELQGWVLYLEGSTDLAVLVAFADKLEHPARKALERPFVIYVANNSRQRHFYALREAKDDMVGVALFDRLDRTPRDLGVETRVWSRREIENYPTRRDVLEAWAMQEAPGTLFEPGRAAAIKAAITEIEAAQRSLGRDIWSADIKATDDVLHPIFRNYYTAISEPLLFRKADYHRLVQFVPADEVAPEVADKLDRILEVSQRARPRLE